MLDDTDRRLILATQAGLPLTPRPYHALAEQLGLSPQDVMVRLRTLLDRGVIRRIGVVPNHYRIGYTANGMTVWDVPDERVDELGEQVGRMPSVSHCYHRPRHLPDWPYNLFAMVHGRTRADVEQEADRIAAVLGSAVRARSVLYSTRILKKTGLRLQS
ncbi:siroheme decarboxylase subunit beta [Methylotetracoccus oryzae]|uniref:siroheme decarboxylase subunit beta n=1 Tax=Methylotetracoccus oryzae TaxID=1919059 RepID=UPI001F3DB7B1|nr:AsnC family transcriptional regulator [Methylotetracoccus oryzae]